MTKPAPEADAAGTWSKLTRYPDTDLPDEGLYDPPFLPRAVPPKRRPRSVLYLILAALLLASLAALAAVLLRPAAPAPRAEGVVTGQPMTVFAPIEGRLTRVLVAPRARISPGSDLFEVTMPGPDRRATADIAARLELARQRGARLELRQKELAGLLARTRITGTDPVAAREAEAMRQRSHDLDEEIRASAGEIAMLERSMASDAAQPVGARLVKATQAAVIARVLAVPGMDVVPGLPLAEIVDCEHLSLTADGSAAMALGLVAGRRLHVRVPESAAGFDIGVPETASRDAVSGRLSVPVERDLIEKATGTACPVGHAVSLQVG